MIKLLPLTVGPITGYTTADSARIFGRGAYEKTDAGGFRRCHGAARIRKETGNGVSETKLFKMNPNFDFTGVVEFYNLKPSKRYAYEIGYFFDEREPEQINAATELQWDDVSKGVVLTAKADTSKPVQFAFGSCRYLLKIFGLNLFDDRGDKIFRSMLDQISGGQALDHLLMVGDQIYADDLNLILPDTFLQQYFARYRETFTQPYIRNLMSQVPTYMILDDHEIEDNWPTKAVKSDYQHKYPHAMQAYQAYQMSHSPVLQMDQSKAVRTPDKYWYTFENGCTDYFMMDTRTERYIEGDATRWRIVSNNQLKALKDWLNNGNNKIKFVVSGVPFFPDFIDDTADKWGGFITQRTDILNFIAENEIGKVVFLSGDVHCSLSAQLVCDEHPKFKVTSIISSSFFWPYPQGKQKDFQLKGLLKTQGSNHFELQNASEVISDDNFTRISAKGASLEVQVYDRKGIPLGKQQNISI